MFYLLSPRLVVPLVILIVGGYVTSIKAGYYIKCIIGDLPWRKLEKYPAHLALQLMALWLTLLVGAGISFIGMLVSMLILDKVIR